MAKGCWWGNGRDFGAAGRQQTREAEGDLISRAGWECSPQPPVSVMQLVCCLHCLRCLRCLRCL